MNDPELLYYDDSEPEPYIKKSKERLKQIMNRFINSTPDKKNEIIHFAIHKKKDDQLIGYCMIAYIDNYHKKCNFGISLGEKTEWGKGYGKEVLREIIRYCFEDLDMNRIGAEIYSHNERSIKLFEKAGFKKEGVLRQSVLKKGKYLDEYVYGLLRED